MKPADTSSAGFSGIVLIVGMARSGTSALLNAFGAAASTQLEVEPHVLWKSGSFRYANDEEFELSAHVTSRIRKKFLGDCVKPIMVEKSPINCLRSKHVHAVFPDARVIYLNRNPIDCVYSNYVRTLGRDSFNLSILWRKYANRSISQNMEYATSRRSLLAQLSPVDVFAFTTYCLRMMALRRRMEHFPFGPKLKNFQRIVETDGIVHYHAEVFRRACEERAYYRAAFEGKFREVCYENIDEQTLPELFDFAGIRPEQHEIDKAVSTWRKPGKSKCEGEIRNQIGSALANLGITD